MSSSLILDVDVGVDDALAVLLALASPEVSVAAITPTFGNTDCAHVSTNILKLFRVLEDEKASFKGPGTWDERWPGLKEGAAKIRVAGKGADRPVEGEAHTAAYFHGRDGLSGISDTHPEYALPESFSPKHLSIEADITSAELILDVLEKAEPNTVTIVALGPLTNVATAHKLSPSTFSRARRVLWMGAAIDVPGNTTPCAEFNLFADPYAGSYLFTLPQDEHTVPLVVCPLDITTPHAVGFPTLMDDKQEREKTDLMTFVVAFLGRVRGIYASLGLGDSMEMHDPMVVWYAIKLADSPSTNANGFETARRQFAVERVGEITRGLCVVDRRGTEETLLEDRSKAGIIEAEKKPVASAAEGAAEDDVKGVEVLVKTPGVEAFRLDFERLVLGL